MYYLRQIIIILLESTGSSLVFSVLKLSILSDVSDEVQAAGFILKHDNRIRTMTVQTVLNKHREE